MIKLQRKILCTFSQNHCASLKFFRKISNSIELEAKPFSHLNLSLKDCNVKIKTADPIVTKENTMYITYESKLKAPLITNKDNCVDIVHNDQGSDIHIDTPFGVNVSLKIQGDGTASVYSMESDNVDITTEKGDIEVGKLKSANIKCSTLTGNIIAKKSIHGNVNFLSESGKIETDRVQGPNIDFCTKKGNIVAKDVYAEELLVNSEEGDLVFKSIHGVSDLETANGNIFVGIASGKAQIAAQEGGDIDVFLSDHTDMFLYSNGGNVQLFNSTNNAAKVHLEACKVKLCDGLDHSRLMERTVGAGTHLIANLHGGGPPVVVKCGKGSAEVKNLSYFERLGHCNKKF